MDLCKVACMETRIRIRTYKGSRKYGSMQSRECMETRRLITTSVTTDDNSQGACTERLSGKKCRAMKKDMFRT